MTALHDTAKHADLIYDIGLHKGEDSEFYLRKGFRVVAFEANPELIRHCRERLREFIASGQMSLVEGAIVRPDSQQAIDGTVSFYRNDAVTDWGTVSPDWAGRNARMGSTSSVLTVPAIDFSRALREHGIPHYMKIDIEGLDMVCVDSLKQFSRRPDYLSIESNKLSLAACRREIDSLIELGYTAFQAIEQSGIANGQTPPQPAREGRYVAHRFVEGCSGLFGAELGGKWKSREDVLRQYRLIRLGYYLVGDDGVMNGWTSRPAQKIRKRIVKWLGRRLRAYVPGWYDTHARHRDAAAPAAAGVAIIDPAQRRALAHPSLHPALECERAVAGRADAEHPAALLPDAFVRDIYTAGTFTQNWFSFNIPALYRGLTAADRTFSNYLEIGPFEGLSTCWFGNYLKARGDACEMTVVDPFAPNNPAHAEYNENYESRFDANMSRFLPGRMICKLKMPSLKALPLLVEQGQSFDLIYVDGSHVALDVMYDAVLCWTLLRPGGVMIFDDYFWTYEPVPRNVLHAVNAFLDLLGGGYRVLMAGYQVMLQKVP